MNDKKRLVTVTLAISCEVIVEVEKSAGATVEEIGAAAETIAADQIRRLAIGEVDPTTIGFRLIRRPSMSSISLEC